MHRPAYARRPQAVQLTIGDLLTGLGVRRMSGFAHARCWPALRLPPGAWTPVPNLQRSDLTLLVVSGALLHTCPHGVDVLLSGDVSRVSSTVVERWRVVSYSPALVAALDPTLVGAFVEIPGAANALLRAVHVQHERSLELREIAGHYSVRERIVRFFAHLVSRVGHTEGDASRVPLGLEQSRIEEIVGAGHTQATAAFRALADAGVLVRDAGGWLFHEDRCRRPAINSASSEPNLPGTVAGSVPN